MSETIKRNFPELHRQVVFKESGGRIIWQPRIGCWFDDRIFSGQGLPDPYGDMDIYGVYEALDCSARLYEFNLCFRRIEHQSLEIMERELNDKDVEVTIVTPKGKQKAVNRRSPNTHHLMNVKWEVETEEELKVAAWREENAAWEWDQECFDELQGKIGQFGAPTMFMPRMNVQSLYIEKMGVERGVYAMHDWPDTVHAYFRALEECHDRLIDVINASPIEIINFGENLHAGTLPPDLFLKYHLPACQRRCDRLHDAGKFVCSHWDGDCGPLLPFARETGLDGIESITPAPQGDVTLEEVKAVMGDDLILLDGIPAIYFGETFPVETLTECAERLIDLFAPRLVLGISDEISSTGDIERIRVVGEIVDSYNARFDS